MKKDYEKKNSFNYGLIIKTALLNIITTAAFIFIFAVVMYLAQTLVSAFYLARKIAKKGFLVGLLVGGAEFIIVTLISMFADKGGITVNTLFHLIIILLSSLIGGIVGVNKAGKQKYI